VEGKTAHHNKVDIRRGTLFGLPRGQDNSTIGKREEEKKTLMSWMSTEKCY